jgi:hypothetical protein
LGKLLPETEAQANFVEVCKRRREPESVYENAWIKYSLVNLAKVISKKISECGASVPNVVTQELPDLFFDTLVKNLHEIEKECPNTNIQKAIITIRARQNKGKNQNRFRITNYGGYRIN